MRIERAACSFVRGILRVVVGSAIAGMGYLSGYMFSLVSDASGFMAVLEFIAAMILLVVSVYGIYWFGGGSGKEVR